MGTEEPKQSPMPQRQLNPVESGQNMETLFSPRLKSVAAMAGWDEESILVASLIVEDTPDREFKRKERSDLIFKTPPSNSSRRKRRAPRKIPIAISVPVINLDEEPEKQENQKEKTETKIEEKEERKTEGEELRKENSGASCSNSVLCMDKLKEELSCAICLEICFEPSTTSCGHSFCKKCLRSAADKCGKKCPKCRQLISNGRSCTVNTVLWNTIQLLFPQEVEARKAAGVLNSREEKSALAQKQQRGEDLSRLLSRDASRRSRRGTSSQDHALEQTLQRRNLPEDFRRALILRRSRQRPSLDENAAGGRSRSTPSQDEDDSLAQSIQRESLSEQLRKASIVRRTRGTPSQDEDASLALRLQREEFMEAFKGNPEPVGSSLSLARANLRAMASRAINVRMRSRPI